MTNRMFTADAFFAGVGGIELGFKQTGCVKIKYANEFDKNAGITYQLNNPDVKFDQRDIHEVRTDEIPACNVMLGGFPCFTKDAWVQTSVGFKHINSIKVGDLVLTREGRFEPVTETMQKIAKHIYEIKIEGKLKFQATGNHPILVRHKHYVWNNKCRRNELRLSEPQWVAVQNLQKGDLVLVNPYEVSNNNSVTNIDAWLLGRYIADGYYNDSHRKGRKNSYNHKVIFCVGYTKCDEFEQHLGKYHATKAYDKDNPHCIKYIITNMALLKLVKQAGRGALNKEIPSFVFGWPVELRKAFINGIYSGDGTKSNKANAYAYTTVSSRLAIGLSTLVELTYHQGVTIVRTKRPKKYVIENRVVNQHDTYKLQWPKQLAKFVHSRVINNEFWKPIKYIKGVDETVPVYNLEVAHSHTYTVNGICVHNCQAFSVAGYQQGFKDPRGTLFFEMLRMIKSKRPRVVFCENVKNLVTHDHNNTFKVIREALVKSGYFVKYKVLNSKDYGNIPQNRERIYIVAFRNKVDFNRFSFPEPVELTVKLRDVIDFEHSVNDKYYYTPDNFKHYDELINSAVNPRHVYQWRRVYVRENMSGVVPTLTANMGTGGNNVPIIITDDGRFRKLTPRECFNVQGYPADFKLPDIANTQLYKQAGNSVVVPVIKRIAENIIKAIDCTDAYEKHDYNEYVLIYNKINNKYDGESYVISSSDDKNDLIRSNIVDADEYNKILRKNKSAEFYFLEKN